MTCFADPDGDESEAHAVVRRQVPHMRLEKTTHHHLKYSKTQCAAAGGYQDSPGRGRAYSGKIPGELRELLAVGDWDCNKETEPRGLQSVWSGL